MLGEAFDIRGQLKSQFLSILRKEVKYPPFHDENYDAKIRRALAMGFYHQAVDGNRDAVDASWLMDLDYFQDHELNRKGNPERTLRQPGARVSLDKARANRAAAQSA
ncbi:unnamed protein product [Clonostachys rosea]|uniref:Uncharacterized protein n=1 Tax=Bionectria ochroleuca TaxID=29856 RepID=A0ABY6V5H6_BIOOC|nr:unnamed protein product [Clonostachys rosea]